MTRLLGGQERNSIGPHPMHEGNGTKTLAENRPAAVAVPGLSYGRGAVSRVRPVEGRIALEMLLERFAHIRLLDDRPRFRRSIVFRGLQTLPVHCSTR